MRREKAYAIRATEAPNASSVVVAFHAIKRSVEGLGLDEGK